MILSSRPDADAAADAKLSDFDTGFGTSRLSCLRAGDTRIAANASLWTSLLLRGLDELLLPVGFN